MKEQEISLETAKLAKLKGFDWECRGYYNLNSKFGTSFQEHYGRFNSNKPSYKADLGSKGRGTENEVYSAPSQSLLQRWLRCKKVLVEVFPIDSWVDWYYKIYKEDIMSPFFKASNCTIEYNSYEQALEAGLIEALNLLDDKS